MARRAAGRSQVFRDSVELRALLSQHLESYSGRELLARRSREGRLPVIRVSSEGRPLSSLPRPMSVRPPRPLVPLLQLRCWCHTIENVSKRARSAENVSELKDQIRSAGLRGTGSRIAVLRVLRESRVPMTHGEVFERLAGLGYDQATIYRNLMDLSRAGLLARADLGDHSWRFELRQGAADHKMQHPHFVCVDCGNIDCLPDGAVSVRGTPGAPKALRRRGIVIQLQGRCDTCLAAAS